MSHRAPELIYRNPCSPEVAMITPGDPEFGEAVSRFLHPESAPFAATILPYSVILRNESGLRITSICGRWVLKNWNGNEITHTSVLQLLRMPPPVATLFLSPLTGMGLAIPHNPQLRIGRRHHWPDQALFEHQTSIAVELDSVLFEDGRVIGPDAANTIAKLRSSLAAEADLFSELLTKEGLALEAHLRDLVASAQPGPSPARDAAPDPVYFGQKRSLSHSLLRILEHEGEDKVMATCRAMLAAPRILLPPQ